MSTLAVTSVGFDPLRDKSYQHTRLGLFVVDYLAWKELGGTAERTRTDYERVLARLCLMFPEKELGEFTDGDVLHCLNQYSPAQRGDRVPALNGFFKWAKLTRKIVDNPMDYLPSIKRGGQRYIDTFTPAEVEALVGLPKLDGTLMLLLLDAGLRKGEARRLRDRDFKPEPAPGQIVVLAGKGNKDRVVPLTRRLAGALAEYALVEGLDAKDHLWYDKPGGHHIRRVKPIAESAFQGWWKRCITEAGVRYRKPHTTRHTFATNWLRRGGRLETLSRVMGHASLSTTFDLYGHLDTRDITADLALIEGAD
ncbi:MAG: tyrosine-type recombinase/integrase [Actinomycetota bacterium]|nr:tyrosine-type recombinase/integrase [Actinomycetota bacterium]